MPQVITRDVRSLRAEVAGQVLVPHDSGYDEARTLWNGGIDKRPAVVVRPVQPQDISAAIAFARAHDLELRSIIRPSSATATPEGLCAPPRTDSSRSCSRAKAIAALMSWGWTGRRITACLLYTSDAADEL